MNVLSFGEIIAGELEIQMESLLRVTNAQTLPLAVAMRSMAVLRLLRWFRTMPLAVAMAFTLGLLLPILCKMFKQCDEQKQ